MSEKIFDKSKVNYYLDLEPCKFANWTLRFGKHKGKTFQDTADEDPAYMDWIIDKFDDQEPLKRFFISVKE